MYKTCGLDSEKVIGWLESHCHVIALLSTHCQRLAQQPRTHRHWLTTFLKPPIFYFLWIGNLKWEASSNQGWSDIHAFFIQRLHWISLTVCPQNRPRSNFKAWYSWNFPWGICSQITLVLHASDASAHRYTCTQACWHASKNMHCHFEPFLFRGLTT